MKCVGRVSERFLPWVGAAVALALGACAMPSRFECEGDAQCVTRGVAGVCQPTDYCSFPDEDCASGQRYAELAPPELAEACVEPEDEPAGSSSGGDELGESTQGAFGESSSGARPQPPAVDWSCVEIDLGQELGRLDVRALPLLTDDFAPSCHDDEGPDVAYRWTAPLEGTYVFRSVVNNLSTVSLDFRASCADAELDCRVGTLAPLVEVHRDFAAGESVLLVADSASDEGYLTLEIILQP